MNSDGCRISHPTHTFLKKHAVLQPRPTERGCCVVRVCQLHSRFTVTFWFWLRLHAWAPIYSLAAALMPCWFARSEASQSASLLGSHNMPSWNKPLCVFVGKIHHPFRLRSSLDPGSWTLVGGLISGKHGPESLWQVFGQIVFVSQTQSVNLRGPYSLSEHRTLPNHIPPAAAISYICCADVVSLDCSEEFI